ncbi:MAG: hypothetical protein Q8P70_02445 [bacterium]|nr:hypothetical protein [bacterium]
MNTKNVSVSFRFLPLITKLGMVALCGSILLYVFQVSFLTQQAYHISSLERDIAKTQEHLKTLYVSNTKSLSHTELQEMAEQRQFTRAERIVYLRLSDSTVAQALQQ